MPGKPQGYDLTQEEWQAMGNLAEDRSILIKPSVEGLYVLICDQEDYLAKGYRQISDHSTYTVVKKFNRKLLSDLTEYSNIIFKGLCNKKIIAERVAIIFI